MAQRVIYCQLNKLINWILMFRAVIIFFSLSISSLVYADNTNFLTESYCRNLTQTKTNNFESNFYYASPELSSAIEYNIYNSCMAAVNSGITEEKFEYRNPYVCLSKENLGSKFSVETISIDDHFDISFQHQEFQIQTPKKRYILNKRENITQKSYKLSFSEELIILNDKYKDMNLIEARNAVYIKNHRNGMRNIVNMTCYDVNEITEYSGELAFN